MSKLNELQRLQADRSTLIEQIGHLRAGRLFEEVREAEADLVLLDDRIRAATPAAVAEIEAQRADEQRLRDAAAARQAKAEHERRELVGQAADRTVAIAPAIDDAIGKLASLVSAWQGEMNVLDRAGALGKLSAPGHAFDRGRVLLAALVAASPELAGELVGAARGIAPHQPPQPATLAASAAVIAKSARTAAAPPQRHQRSRDDIDAEMAAVERNPAVALARATQAA